MTEQEKREQVVSEARTWIDTPYRIRGRVKGAGCDCGSLLMSIAVNCGLMENEELEVYRADCWCHWSDEKYLRNVMRHTTLVMQKIAFRSDKIKPGSLLLTKCAGSKFYNHGGIVTAWPSIVHALHPKVEEVNATQHFLWTFHEVAVFEFLKIKGEA